jgi:protein TonB
LPDAVMEETPPFSPASINLPEGPANLPEGPANLPERPAPADTGSLTNSGGEGLTVIAPIYDADYLSNPVPPYPPAAKRLKLQGTVIVRVFVTPSGKPETVNLQKSSGASILDDAAVDAVKHWLFVPARSGDKPISAWVDVPILFRLH